MQNYENATQDLITEFVKSSAHHGKPGADKKHEDINMDAMIDCEVPGDSYYKQYGDNEQELQKLFSKE